MPDHGFHRRSRVGGANHDTGVARREHAKDLVREPLADVADVPQVG